MTDQREHFSVELIYLLSLKLLVSLQCFPGGLVVKNLPADAGEVGSIPGLGRSPRGGNGNSLQ